MILWLWNLTFVLKINFFFQLQLHKIEIIIFFKYFGLYWVWYSVLCNLSYLEERLSSNFELLWFSWNTYYFIGMYVCSRCIYTACTRIQATKWCSSIYTAPMSFLSSCSPCVSSIVPCFSMWLVQWTNARTGTTRNSFWHVGILTRHLPSLLMGLLYLLCMSPFMSLCDEDITPTNTNNTHQVTMQGPITHARARQLNL